MIVPVILLIAYCILLLVFIYAWRKAMTMRVRVGKARVKNGISVLVACRNEAKNIHQLIKSFSEIDYPSEKFEIILVNDHSSDHTAKLIKKQIEPYANFRLIELDESAQGKKAALQEGISQAKFELIATTDADCLVPVDWLSYLSLFFEDDETGILIGGVKLTGNSFFSQLQIMEFNSLLGSTGAAMALGHPVMGNGANLAFRKQWFNEVGGYKGNDQIASGDDEFLIRKIVKQHPGGWRFLHFGESIVSTTAQPRLSDFISQRLRWASKWRDNPDIVTRILAVMILTFQLSFLMLIVVNGSSFNYATALIISKVLLEFVFIFNVTRYSKTKFFLLAFLLLQFIYPIYVIIIGFLSLSGAYQWKGRNYNR